MISSIQLKDKMDEITGKHCSPIDVVQLNDQVVRVSYIDGEFHWHKHNDQDEFFYILKGDLIIQLKNHHAHTTSIRIYLIAIGIISLSNRGMIGPVLCHVLTAIGAYPVLLNLTDTKYDIKTMRSEILH